MKIQTLRANVSREEAIEQFRARGAARWFRTLTMGELRSVAEAYVPFLLFRVKITNRGRSDQRRSAWMKWAGPWISTSSNEFRERAN
jgi:hypothetical protein